MADFSSAEKDKLSAVDAIRREMQGSVKLLASPSPPGESVKSCVRRVAAGTRLTYGQVRRLWYGEWRVIPAHVADRIREGVTAHERRIDAEIATLRKRQADLWALTHQSSDPEFYRGQPGVGGGEAD